MNYKVLLNDSYKFEVVDVREPIDLSRFVAYTTSTWKKIITASQRNYTTMSSVNLHDGRTRILTYPDGKLAVVCPGKGDYIPPGSCRISNSLESVFQGWDGSRCVARSRLVPMSGHKILNNNFVSIRSSFCVYSNQPSKDSVMGWCIHQAPDNTSYYLYIDRSEDGGIRCRPRRQGSAGVVYCAMATQMIRKEIFAGSTRLRIRAEGATTLFIGTDQMIKGDDGIWQWDGEAITDDVQLAVGIGTDVVRSVEFLDD